MQSRMNFTIGLVRISRTRITTSPICDNMESITLLSTLNTHPLPEVSWAIKESCQTFKSSWYQLQKDSKLLSVSVQFYWECSKKLGKGGREGGSLCLSVVSSWCTCKQALCLHTMWTCWLAHVRMIPASFKENFWQPNFPIVQFSNRFLGEWDRSSNEPKHCSLNPRKTNCDPTAPCQNTSLWKVPHTEEYNLFIFKFHLIAPVCYCVQPSPAQLKKQWILFLYQKY